MNRESSRNHKGNPFFRIVCTVNTDESNPLIYDFYNFPKHFYAQTFKSNSSRQASADVKDVLTTGGWLVKEVARGLDHGLWGKSLGAMFGRL